MQDEPSKVGKKLTELTVRRVIVIVLAMIMVFPFLDDPESIIGNPEFNSFEIYKLKNLHKMTSDFNATGNITKEFFRDQVKLYASNPELKNIVYMKLGDWNVETTNEWVKETSRGQSHHVLFDTFEEALKKYRTQDALPVPEVCDECETMVLLDCLKDNQWAAQLSLVKTIVIVVCLSVAGESTRSKAATCLSTF